VSAARPARRHGPWPAALLFGTILLMIALHKVAPVGQVFSFPWRYLGVVPAMAGAALIASAAERFRRAGTTVLPFHDATRLVADGPYTFSRNPMYLGMAVLLCGIAVGLGSITPWLTVPAFVWLITIGVIKVEERLLESAFGRDFLDYKSRVRRWI